MYKFTNKEDMMKFLDAFTAANADQPCTIPFGEVVDGMKKYYEVMGMTIDLVNLIREEAELKKHHRAYLHVREELEDTADEAMERIVELLRNSGAPHVWKPENFPFSDTDGDDEAVTISKEKYDSMVDDLLTMAELIDMVADMRTRDMEAIRTFAKFVPSFAAYEHNRLRLYSVPTANRNCTSALPNHSSAIKNFSAALTTRTAEEAVPSTSFGMWCWK